MDFCTNCGKELNGATFCTNCGARVESAPAASTTGSNALLEKFNENKNLIIAGAAALLVIIITIIAIASCSGGYKGKLKAFMNAYKKGDEKKIVALMPEKLVKKMGGKSDLEDRLEENLEYQFGKLDDVDGDIKKMSYKISDVEKLDKDDIKDLKKEIRNYWGASLDIKQAVKVEIEMTIPIDGDKETEDFEVTLVKIGSKWYYLRSDIDLGEFCQ